MKPTTTVVLWLSLASLATAQTPQPSPASDGASPTATSKAGTQDERPLALAAAHRQLLERLGIRPRPTAQDRRRMLTEFLAKHGATAQATEVLHAQFLLGSLQLRQQESLEAIASFATVVASAPAGSELAIKGRFGAYQAHRQAGDLVAARRQLDAIDLTRADEETATAVRVALAQLQKPSEPEVGHPLPRLTLGIDVHGRELRQERMPPGPQLLVFWSIAHPASQRRLEDLAAAWRQCGLPASNLIAYAVEDDDAALQRLVDARGWSFAVLPAHGSGYLDPDWLALGVTAVPSAFLRATDGTLLARDLTPDRLIALMRH